MWTPILITILIYLLIGFVNCILLPKKAYEYLGSFIISAYTGPLKPSKGLIYGCIMLAISVSWLPMINSIIRLHTVFKD